MLFVRRAFLRRTGTASACTLLFVFRIDFRLFGFRQIGLQEFAERRALVFLQIRLALVQRQFEKPLGRTRYFFGRHIYRTCWCRNRLGCFVGNLRRCRRLIHYGSATNFSRSNFFHHLRERTHVAVENLFDNPSVSRRLFVGAINFMALMRVVPRLRRKSEGFFLRLERIIFAPRNRVDAEREFLSVDFALMLVSAFGSARIAISS